MPMQPATRWKIAALIGAVLCVVFVGLFVLQYRVPAEKAIASGARVEFNLKTGEVKQAPKKEVKAADEAKEAKEVEAKKEEPKKEETKEVEPHKEEAKKEEKAEAEAHKEEAAATAPAVTAITKRPSGPVIAIVIAGAGLSRSTTEALYGLPPAISLSFSPYSADLKEALKKGLASGREVYIDLPLEPKDYPYTDPGPYALLTGLDEVANRQRLALVLKQLEGEGGVKGLVAGLDERYSANAKAMEWLMEELEKKKLRFAYLAQPLNAHLQQSNKRAIVIDQLVDHKLDAKAIDEKLAELEALARRSQTAIALARPYPVTVERLNIWAKALEKKGITLVPLTVAAGGNP